MTTLLSHDIGPPVNATARAGLALRLRPYQIAAIDAIQAVWARGLYRALVTLPTGTGKTALAAGLSRRLGGRTLFITHRDELLQQTARTFGLMLPGVDVGIVKADRDESDAHIVVASIQTLARAARRQRLGDFDLVVGDEAHHFCAPTFRDVLDHFAPRGARVPVLGLTATPDRGDGLGLDSVFDEIAFTFDLRAAIRGGYLAPPRALRIRLALDLETVHVRNGDLDAHELDAALRDADAPRHALRAFQQHASERHTVVFTPSVPMAHEVARLFSGAGVAAAAVDGEMSTHERRAILGRFDRGDLQVLANCQLLVEGWDAPRADCAIVLRPTTSRPMFAQMIGRVLRPFPGKRDALVIDLAGNTSRHQLATVASLLGMPEPSSQETSREVVRLAGRGFGEQPAALAFDGELIAQRVDLLEAAAPVHWLAVSATRFVLPCGERGSLLLDAVDLDAWRVRFCARSGEQTTIADGLPLDFAAGTGSDYARALGADAFIKRSARWRDDPASERQIDALQRWRLTAPLGITKGQAADALTIAAARRLR